MIIYHLLFTKSSVPSIKQLLQRKHGQGIFCSCLYTWLSGPVNFLLSLMLSAPTPRHLPPVWSVLIWGPNPGVMIPVCGIQSQDNTVPSRTGVRNQVTTLDHPRPWCHDYTTTCVGMASGPGIMCFDVQSFCDWWHTCIFEKKKKNS